MAELVSSISRFCRLIVLGTWGGILRSAAGEGGNVRKGGKAGGLCNEVYKGLNRMEEGVTILSSISNAVSFDPSEAVVKEKR
jgi:hypothetical protein